LEVSGVVARLGFKPYVANLDDLLRGGIPEGSWVSLYGPPGGFKTLHALAWCLSGLANRDRCVYVSTEMDYAQLKRQLDSLGWKLGNVYEKQFTNKIVEDKEYGSYEMVWVDLDSLRFWAFRLNRLVSEEKGSGGRKLYFWYNDPTLLTHLVMTALGAVGVLERAVSEVSLDEVLYARVKDGLYGEGRSKFKVNKDVRARVVIDSMSMFILGRYATAGKILTDMKVRLAAPNITYMVTSHVSKMTEEELGANIGHIVDGRIRLWQELDEKSGEARHHGWIVKMRETDHSRRLHSVSLEKHDQAMRIVWS